MNYISTFFNDLLHLLYPHACAGCGSDIISEAQLLCVECSAGLPLTNFFDINANPVEKIFWGRIPVIGAGSLVYFTKQSIMQRLLHLLKYRGNKEVGLYFGRRIAEDIMDSPRFGDIDVIVPLPLHLKKQRSRGYNQAEVISTGLAEKLKLPVVTNAVNRKRRTTTQTHMNRIDRWGNMEGKFELTRPQYLAGKHVLLVDDVITTGATLEACGAEILKAEGCRLSIASVAYTSK